MKTETVSSRDAIALVFISRHPRAKGIDDIIKGLSKKGKKIAKKLLALS